MSETEDLYERVLDHPQTGVYLVDRRQKILFWSEGAEKITGHLRPDVLGRYAQEVIQADDEDHPGDESTGDSPNIGQVLRDVKPTFAEVMLRHKSGHLVPVRIRGVAIRNDHGTIIGAAESFEESLSAADWTRQPKC